MMVMNINAGTKSEEAITPREWPAGHQEENTFSAFQVDYTRRPPSV